MKSIIFQKKSIKDTFDLAYKNEIEESHLRFMGNICLNLLDYCSNKYYIKYFDSKNNNIVKSWNINICSRNTKYKS